MSDKESPDARAQPHDLGSRVREWLDSEGYPTEFRTASVFRRFGFRVRQGYYVRDDRSEAVREIDVLATASSPSREHLIRAEHVVECKWSRDKPWVIFTSSDAQMAPPACVAQTIGSALGSTILWAIAGDESLHNMDLFSTPTRPGFGGRQAFSRGNDHFYSAMASVTTLASLVVGAYDPPSRKKGELPTSAVVAFPLIVVEGQLFEAYYDVDQADVRVEPVKRLRCHWRGAPSWRLHATVDIVSLGDLDAFAASRAEEVSQLLNKMEKPREQVAKCFEEHSLEPLTVLGGARGVVGVPNLLREALREDKQSGG